MKGGKGDGRARDGKTFSHSILLISTTAHDVHIIRTGDIIYIYLMAPGRSVLSVFPL